MRPDMPEHPVEASRIDLERWQQIDELFQAVVELEPERRAVFLEAACVGDQALRSEVESLLASDSDGWDFVEKTAFEVAAALLVEDQPQLAPGETIGHYRIVAAIGRGGMGEVYLAEDIRLGRKVALKLLPADFTSDQSRMRRFQQEARAASALNHPNILTIHDIGEFDGHYFIASEFIEGETLRQRLSRERVTISEALDMTIQMASALSVAHEAGIVHRDIKPENIMLRPDGYVKVLDFGLAKLAGQHEPTTEADAADKSDISSGLVMGTVAYMSPEQALGREVDHRTDIFSLGVVMYEMAAGRRPFAGATANETLDRIIHAEPEAIARSNDHVPPELERIIRKCLEKDRERRYQSARDLVDDLRNLKREIEPGASTAVTGAPAWGRNRVGLVVGLVLAVLMAVGVGLYFFSGREGAIDSLAVLPFVNVGADPNVEVLSDGITESLINSLSQLPNLKVIARASVFQYKGRAIDPQTVGRKLNVRAVLTGQVAQHGDALFISAELMDAQDSRHLWGEQYHRPLADIFLIQEEIAKELSETLRLRLSRAEQQRLTKRYTENTQAYHLYLTGRYFWNRRDAEGMRKAIESFQQAIALDPTYALAYAGLADTYALLGSASYDAQPPREDMPKARAAATRALELDDTLAEAHSALAFVKGWYDWDWPGAERGLQRALDLNPNYATAHQRYGWYYLAMGRPEEALAEMRRAQQCDPLSPIIAVNIGAVLYYQRHYDQALAQFGKVVEMDPSFRVSHSWQGWAYAEKGAYADAIAAFQRETLPWEQSRWGLAMVYARMGKKHEARQLLNQLHELAKQRYVPSSAFIVIYAALGEKDQAFTWLERAYEEHDEDLDLLNVDPKLDSLRSDPRFAELARRVGLRS